MMFLTLLFLLNASLATAEVIEATSTHKLSYSISHPKNPFFNILGKDVKNNKDFAKALSSFVAEIIIHETDELLRITRTSNDKEIQSVCLEERKEKSTCLLTYSNDEDKIDRYLTLSLNLEKINSNNIKYVTSFEASLTMAKSQQVLVSIVSKIDELFQINNIFEEEKERFYHWSINALPNLNKQQESKKEQAMLPKTEMLSNSYMKKKLLFSNIPIASYSDNAMGKKTADNIEIWQSSSFDDSSTKALFINSIVRSYGGSISLKTFAHAESFIHPALISHPYPKRVALLSKFPFPYIREIIKYEWIEMIDVIGYLKDYDIVLEHFPELNDCSTFDEEEPNCLEDERIFWKDYDDANEWMDKLIKEKDSQNIIEEVDDETYAQLSFYDVIYIDSPSFSSNEESEWISTSFIKKLQNLIDFPGTDSMIVINSGHLPEFGTEVKQENTQDEREDLLRYASNEDSKDLNFESIVAYDEPMAKPLNSVFLLLFYKQEYSYSKFFTRSINSIDLDIMDRFYPRVNDALPTVWYDGPTHERFQKPSRVWEAWFCSKEPWKSTKICNGFFNKFFSSEYHHNQVEVREHNVKGRSVHALEDIPQGHFVLASDVTTMFHIDYFQWQELNDFIERHPKADMYKQLRDYIIAYGFESDVFGKTGWSVSLASNNTFTNHGCTPEARSVSFAQVFDYKEKLIFSPLIQRRSDLFGGVEMTTRDIKKGEEILQDYTYFRDDPDQEFLEFLTNMCSSGVGLVPLSEKKE